MTIGTLEHTGIETSQSCGNLANELAFVSHFNNGNKLKSETAAISKRNRLGSITNMAKLPETIRETPSKPTVTDEQLLAITTQGSQEFADLAIADKLRWYQLDNQRLHQAKETLEKKQKGYGLHVKIENGVMTVTIPVKDKLEASSTGKTLSVASTHGNIKTECMVNGKPLTIGLNAYIPA